MNLSSSRVQIAAGDGVVARQGATLVVLTPTSPEQEPFVDQLLELCAAGTDERPSVIRRVGALVTQTPAEAVPSFGILFQTGDSLVALLVGEVTLTVTSSRGVELVKGTDASTYVERVLRGEHNSLWLAARTAPAPDPRSSLTSGVIRGAGALVLPGMTDLSATAVAPQLHSPGAGVEPQAAGPTLADQGFESISLVEEPPVEAAFQTSETATTSASARPPDAPSSPDAQDALGPDRKVPMVEGIYCSRGHFNSPESIFCTQCGISMVQQTHNRLLGPRPPLGVLVTDQGAVFTLVHDYVLGREPETAPEVVAGTAIAIALDDEKLSMSRIHAHILLDGWEVRVEDAHSANGTFVAHGDSDWTRLEPGRPTTIRPGTRIGIGGRTLTFETHQRS